MGTITEKRKLGNLGEDIACKYLIGKGYTILDRNYLKKFGELDIVAKKQGIIHFVEVKSVSRPPERMEDNSSIRAGENLDTVSSETESYRPEDNLHTWKLQRLSNTIQTYLAERGVSDETVWQFDVIIVYINKKDLISKVSLMENVIL